MIGLKNMTNLLVKLVKEILIQNYNTVSYIHIKIYYIRIKNEKDIFCFMCMNTLNRRKHNRTILVKRYIHTIMMLRNNI